jgi:hypothetical protein
LKILHKFDIRLKFSDINKIVFVMNSKYGNSNMAFFKDFYVTYSLKSFLKGYVFIKIGF